ncbi:MAG: salicylate biosynthesis isochorismate synthase/menaquinone-specific isochorismate synthase [Chloroflexi bacterium]|nr:MAG: salicylate biosynthesis isochorismate synthase/menaquinone-specific isochorismate synthase [Chloroflexota bacterium]
MREPLATAVAAARSHGALGTGALATAAQAVPLPDLIDAFAATTDDAFYWEQPAQEFGLLALGATASIEVAGPGRFAEAASWWREIVERASLATPSATPFAAGGFAFAESPEVADGVWSAWPRGAWVAPAVVLERRGAMSAVQLQVCEAEAMDSVQALADAALRAQPSRAATAPPGISLRDDPGHTWWDDSLRSVLEAIAAGDLRKQVLARRVCAQAEASIDPAQVLRALRSRFPSATIFAVRRGGATFLGASPEELVGLRGTAIEAAALAGTSRGTGDGRWLLDDPKERSEHAFVVEALRERLAPICGRLDAPGVPQLMTLPDLSHLYTPVSGELLQPRGLLSLVESLHPTPAVGAVPRAADRSRELEPFDRGWYAGPVGWARGDSGGEGDAVVALRSALVWENHAALYAGCGIVPGSDPEIEWREARLKMEAVLGALGVPADRDAGARG